MGGLTLHSLYPPSHGRVRCRSHHSAMAAPTLPHLYPRDSPSSEPRGGAGSFSPLTLFLSPIRAVNTDVAKLDLYVPRRQRVVIHGNVQGVGFRLWIRNVADTLALVGTCRQLPDGTCEVVVQGEKNLLKQFVVACKRGPSEAFVERVEVSTMPVDQSLERFEVAR